MEAYIQSTPVPRCLAFCAGRKQRIDQFEFLSDWGLEDFFMVDVSSASEPDLVADVTDPRFIASIPTGAFQHIAFLSCPIIGVFTKSRFLLDAYLDQEFFHTLLQNLPASGSLILNNFALLSPIFDNDVDRSVQDPELFATYVQQRQKALKAEALAQQQDPRQWSRILVRLETWLQRTFPGTAVLTHLLGEGAEFRIITEIIKLAPPQVVIQEFIEAKEEPRCLALCAGHNQSDQQFDFLRETWGLENFLLVDSYAGEQPDIVVDITHPEFIEAIPRGAFQYISFMHCPMTGTFARYRGKESRTNIYLNPAFLLALIERLPLGGSLIVNNLVALSPNFDPYLDRTVTDQATLQRQIVARQEQLRTAAELSYRDPTASTEALDEVSNWLAEQLPGTEVSTLVLIGPPVKIISEITRVI